MKHNYLNRIRKAYHKPVIEEISLDKEISLIMISTPPDDPPGPSGVQGAPTIDYKEQTYKTKDPFGGSKPAY